MNPSPRDAPGERSVGSTVRSSRACFSRVALALVLLLFAPGPTVRAQGTSEEGDRLQREAADRWVARDFAAADRLYGRAIAAFEAAGDRMMLAHTLSNRSFVRLSLERWTDAEGDARRADTLFSQMIAELRRTDDGSYERRSALDQAQRGRAGALGALTSAALATGRLADAERTQREQIAIFEALGDENPAGLASGFEGLADIAVRAGRDAEAAEFYERAAAFWKRSGEVYASDYVEERRRVSAANALEARARAGGAEVPVDAAEPLGDVTDERTARVIELEEPGPATAPEADVTAEAADVQESVAVPETAEAPPSPPEGNLLESVIRRIGDTARIAERLVPPLFFGAVILFILVRKGQLRRRVLASRSPVRLPGGSGAPSALPGSVRAATPPASRPAVAAASPSPGDLPPPVAGGAARTVVEHKGTGWCGCIVLLAIVGGLAVAIPWILRMIDGL